MKFYHNDNSMLEIKERGNERNFVMFQNLNYPKVTKISKCLAVSNRRYRDKIGNR